MYILTPGKRAPLRPEQAVLFSESMSAIRIICTHDGLPTARLLERMLSAEDHLVELHYGRASLEALGATRSGSESVVLIWSRDAQVSHYMLQWLAHVEPRRLVEVASGSGYPDDGRRRAAVVDFGAWKGVRGGPAWRALKDRLRVIERGAEPPPAALGHAAFALGAVSAVAVATALVVRIQDVLTPDRNENIARSEAGSASPSHALGGPLYATEPASSDEGVVRIDPLLHADTLESDMSPPTFTAELAPSLQARRLGLVERFLLSDDDA